MCEPNIVGIDLSFSRKWNQLCGLSDRQRGAATIGNDHVQEARSLSGT